MKERPFEKELRSAYLGKLPKKYREARALLKQTQPERFTNKGNWIPRPHPSRQQPHLSDGLADCLLSSTRGKIALHAILSKAKPFPGTRISFTPHLGASQCQLPSQTGDLGRPWDGL